MTTRFPQVFNCELLPKNALFRDGDLEVGEDPGLGVEECDYCTFLAFGEVSIISYICAVWIWTG